jgi:DNA-binding response OmpR family regulator
MKILLAEDEEQLSRVLVAAMKSVNYDVDAVFNGRDAVELAKKNSYDVIILDIMMPIMDGITALKQIRKSGDKTLCINAYCKSRN